MAIIMLRTVVDNIIRAISVRFADVGERPFHLEISWHK